MNYMANFQEEWQEIEELDGIRGLQRMANYRDHLHFARMMSVSFGND